MGIREKREKIYTTSAQARGFAMDFAGGATRYLIVAFAGDLAED